MELILFSIIFIVLFLIIPVFAYFYGKTCAYREMVEKCMKKCKDISKLNDMALIYESEIEIDTEHLNEKRIEMYEKKDTDVLLEIIPGLNSIIEDAEAYKDWILRQFDK